MSGLHEHRAEVWGRAPREKVRLWLNAMARGDACAPPRWPLLAWWSRLCCASGRCGHGIPFALGVDEPEVMERAVGMMKTGDFNPHFFDYPALYMYMQALVAVVRFLVGAMQRRVERAGPGADADFYVWGRAVTAIFGTATVWSCTGRPCAGARGRAARGGDDGGDAAARPRVALRADRRAGSPSS